MSKQDRKYVKNYGGVIWREKRKGKKNKLEQALNTRTVSSSTPYKSNKSQNPCHEETEKEGEKVRERKRNTCCLSAADGPISGIYLLYL